MNIDKRSALIGAAASTVFLLALFAILARWFSDTRDSNGRAAAPASNMQRAAEKTAAGRPGGSLAAQSVELSEPEFANFKIRPVAEHEFRIQREAIGNIEFNPERSE